MAEKKQSEIYQGKAMSAFLGAGGMAGMALVSHAIIVASDTPSIFPLISLGCGTLSAAIGVCSGLNHTLAAHRAAGREEAAEAEVTASRTAHAPTI